MLVSVLLFTVSLPYGLALMPCVQQFNRYCEAERLQWVEDAGAYCDAMSELLNDGARRQALEAQGIARAAEFRADKVYARQLQLLDALCHKSV